MSVRVLAGRPCNVTLHCIACQATVTLFGGWNGTAIAAWSDVHRLPILAGWDVVDGTGHASHVDSNLPPTVHVRQ